MTKKIKYPALRMGSKGDLVSQMQSLLEAAGANVKVSGNFTIGTRSAVSKFQKNNKLEVTGICDEKTWDALLKYANIKKQEAAKKEPTLEEKVEILWKEYLKKAK